MTDAAPRPVPPEAAAFVAMPGVVGVTGHRLNRLSPRAEAELAAICAALFADPHPDCTLLSCLAEGVDTIAAEAWPEDRGLVALLPTDRVAWRRAMAEVMDPARFDALADRAQVTTLNQGGRIDFAALSAALVERSDRVFAVWDGRPGRPGGTGSVVARARAAGKPVLHLRFADGTFAW